MKLIKKFYWLLFSASVFIVYCTTLAPSVVEIDSGELAAVQATLGIAHPTGYPLFTILGYLFSLIPLGFSKIYQLNILAAAFCSLGAGIFVYSVKLVLDNAYRINSKENKRNSLKGKKLKTNRGKNRANSPTEASKFIAALTAGLVLSFSRTFWFQSTSVEVYSLHIFLINLIILFLLKAYLFDKKEKDKIIKKSWLLFAAVLALGFTNHMTTILIIPGTAYLYFEKNRTSAGSVKTILLMLSVFFFILIAFYIYLPVRAAQNPALNWGNPINFENFFRHITGKQYQVWIFSSAEAAKKQLVYFFNTLPKEFSISLLICILGLFVSFFTSRKIFVFLIITFLSTVAYSINYDIVDIDSYFLLAFVTLSFFSAFGILKILIFLKHNKHSYFIPAILVFLFAGVETFYNYSEADQSGVYTFQDYTVSLLKSTAKNSVVFSYQWDYFISESYYFRYVEGIRKDVAVIDKELLRRSWYYNQLKTNNPLALNGLHDDINAFITSVKPFESGAEFNPNIIEMNFRKLMTDLTAQNVEKENFYVAPELFENEMQKGEYILPQGYTLVPDLFLFKVVKGTGYYSASDPNFKIRFPKNNNKYTDFIKINVANMLARRALYEVQYDRISRARVYIKKIKNDFPGYLLPAGLNQIKVD